MAGRLSAVFAVLATCLAAPWAGAQPSQPRPPRLFFELLPADEPAWPTLPSPPEGLRAARRIVVPALAPDAAGRVAASRGWPVWLSVVVPEPGSIDAAAWPQWIRDVVAAAPALAAVELVLGDVRASSSPGVRTGAFLVKLAAAEIRARDAGIPIVLGGPASTSAARDALVTPDVAPSLDAYAIDAGGDVESTTRWIADRDPGASLVQGTFAVVDAPAAASARAGAARFAELEVSSAGAPIAARGYVLSAQALRAVLPVAGRLRDLDPSDLATVSTTPDTLRISANDVDVTGSRRWRLLYNLSTLGTYLVVDGLGPSEERLDLSLVLPSAGTVVVRDPLTGRDRPALRVTRDDARQRTEATVVLPGQGPWVVDFNRGAEAGFIAQEEVTGARLPTVEEILARHQARQALERDASPRYVMNGRIQQYFRPTVTDPGYDVITVNRFFVDRVEGTEWEEREFSVNGAKFGEPRPPFPLLQAEKVLTPPLQIELDARYRYRLQGSEAIAGRDTWVVVFEPERKDQSLYRGTVWIDKTTYARVRQQAAQTALSAPVISNDEVQDFAPVRASDGREVWLPARMYNQQLILIAGRNLLVERRITFSDYAIAPGDFAAQRQEARGGARTMYRDTDAGVRYFVKEGDRRVVSDVATTRAKALALGVTIDPGFGYPLPIGGINYLNFRFRGRQDTQVAVLFAGVLAAGNIQRPKALWGKVDASLDFFAIAPPSTDRLFGPAGEREDQSLLTWPLSTGLNLGWQATTYQRISGQYLFRFDGYVRNTTTAEDFVTPTSTVTNGVGLLYEYRRSGYSLTANGTWARRASWRPWGDPTALTATPAAYAKYQAVATKAFYLGPFSKIIVNGAYFGGDQLDRFSQYQFGLFDDTRIHGVPSAGVRYGELAMARGQYSFNLLDQYRMDFFVDQAWGRTRPGGVPGVSAIPWEPLTGVGVAFNVRVPGKVAFIRGEVGHSFLPDRYRGLGSTTVQVMLLKPLN
ncbi:hypothetical protein TBR22_A45150 [Luteitalea sp. TBR-22]|uniref:sigma-E factor regulatory protein RseB domain-containing protein n=1 Tax=Luteitalea sp. TBR-22 TaxID=2802971 RepID=UPI001AFC0BEF|nr:sigma-E factor regulatory protein RseB domain-containing protein [Luteitalea sp. TBR-22]BCS35288.1 hypothetical protein TBR22_A45150 [Luteitalea sp. TBR-22]